MGEPTIADWIGKAETLKELASWRERAEKAERDADKLVECVGEVSDLLGLPEGASIVEGTRAIIGRVAKLETALRPFAQFAERFGDTARDDNWVLTRNPSGSGNLTMGDVRSARSALATGEP